MRPAGHLGLQDSCPITQLLPVSRQFISRSSEEVPAVPDPRNIDLLRHRVDVFVEAHAVDECRIEVDLVFGLRPHRVELVECVDHMGVGHLRDPHLIHECDVGCGAFGDGDH